MTLSNLNLVQKSGFIFQWVGATSVPMATQVMDFRITYILGVRNPNTALVGFTSSVAAPAPQQDFFGWFQQNP